ncbi:MAG: HAD-IIIA family hydrolase [Bacteroides sp.]|nr:HAD-IIIA family hydrolase [Roseburia sp.]MCM1346779.1 HAD-IIIA family hydrolase [Bacteroides sp.]MCM1420655.1 HAD-IIIA family hydrolase [Bacteroides sp.]
MTDTIIFDLDGTLLDTLDDIQDNVNLALALYGFSGHTRDEICSFLGNGVRELVRCSLPKTVDEATVDKVLACFLRFYLRHSVEKTVPYKGVMEMLAECKKRGYHTAIVSNKLDSAVKDLHHRFFRDVVDVAIGETPEISRKPSPDMVYKAVDMLGSTLASSVYVGDSEVDIATAKNSGLKCVSVSWGFRDKEFLVNAGAEVIIDSPNELFAVLDGGM